MRCYCCNNILTPVEATRRFKESETFTDMCDVCLDTIIDVETVEGAGLNDEEKDEEE